MRIYPQTKGFQPVSIHLDTPECIAKMLVILASASNDTKLNNPNRSYAKAVHKILSNYTKE